MSATIVAVVSLVRATPAMAQDVPSFAESVYLVASDDVIAAQCTRSFARPLTNSGAFIERNSPEIASVVSGCVEEAGSLDAMRECDLAVANSEVDLVVVSVTEPLGDSVLIEVSVRSPALNAGVWSADGLLDGDNPALTVRDVCAQMGTQFAASRGVDLVPNERDTVEIIPITIDEPDPLDGDEIEVPDLQLDTPVPTIASRPSSVQLTLVNGRHRFNVLAIAQDGTTQECNRRLTNRRECSLEAIPSGEMRLQLSGGRLQLVEDVQVFSPATSVLIEHQRWTRRGFRIAGGAMMGLGWALTIPVTLIAAGNDNNEGLGFIAVPLTILFGGIAVLTHGVMGPHIYSSESYAIGNSR